MIEQRRSTPQSISFLCSLGLFLAGYLFYSSSFIESYYAADFHLSSWQIGIAQATIPLGAMVGAVLAGWLADIFGRHRLLVWNFLLLIFAGMLGGFAFDYYSLCATRAINGFLAGTLYPLCAAYLIEMTTQTALARQTARLMFINCLAAPTACLLGLLLTYFFNEHIIWRLLASVQIIPAAMAYSLSRQLPESEVWFQSAIKSKTAFNPLKQFGILFNPTYRYITICLTGAWFLMDVAYYGINFFVHYLLNIIEVHALPNTVSTNALLSQKTIWSSFIINIFFMLGALASIFVIERIDLYKLQKYGFLFASLSLFLLACFFYTGSNHLFVVILLFILFNFSINIGPDVTTYLLSATSYPVEIRASGHGMIAGLAKFGSFLGVLLLPKMQDSFGHETVIFLLSGLLFAAYLFTTQLARAATDDVSTMQGEVSYETN